MNEKRGEAHGASPLVTSDHIFSYGLADRIGVDGDAYYKFNIFSPGEILEPIEELAEEDGILVAHDLIEIVNKNMGDVVVAGMQAADKALDELIGTGIVRAGFDKTSLIRNVKGELLFFLDAYNVAVFHCDGLTNEVDQTFGLSGTLQTHD